MKTLENPPAGKVRKIHLCEYLLCQESNWSLLRCSVSALDIRLELSCEKNSGQPRGTWKINEKPTCGIWPWLLKISSNEDSLVVMLEIQKRLPRRVIELCGIVLGRRLDIVFNLFNCRIRVQQARGRCDAFAITPPRSYVCPNSVYLTYPPTSGKDFRALVLGCIEADFH